jgi:hypothetical protein
MLRRSQAGLSWRADEDDPRALASTTRMRAAGAPTAAIAFADTKE